MSITKPDTPLPNPRIISNLITSHVVHRRRRRGNPRPDQQIKDNIVNQLFVFYGQFLDHDVSNSFPLPVTV